MTPWQTLVASGTLDPKDVPKNWNWRAALPLWVWHKITLRQFDDWDMAAGEPPFVMLEHSGTKTSFRLAMKHDDQAEGLFYYRDWTSSGIPIIREDDTYWSGFWFQKMSDAVRFHEQHGGAASWQPDFEAKRQAMNRKRDRTVRRNP